MRQPNTLRTGFMTLFTFAIGVYVLNSFSDVAWAQVAFTPLCDSVAYDQPNGIRGTISDLPCRMGTITLPDSGIYTLTVDGHYDAVGSYALSLSSSTTTVQENSDDIPRWFELAQNYPNPFNPSTRIHFQLPKQSHVTIKIFDIQGRLVHTLVDRQFKAGRFDETWAR